MIAHRIVVHKREEPVPVLYAVPRLEGKRLGQQEYNEYLNDLKFHEGDFVTYGNVGIPSLHSTYMILAVETDVDKVLFRYREDAPVCLYMVQCADEANPWKKWDSVTGYRHLSQDEFNRLIKPAHDRLQDYCNKFPVPAQ